MELLSAVFGVTPFSVAWWAEMDNDTANHSCYVEYDASDLAHFFSAQVGGAVSGDPMRIGASSGGVVINGRLGQ